MAVANLWIKRNMLSSVDKFENKISPMLVLKEGRCLKKTSIPEWNLNKCSNSGELLRDDVTTIEHLSPPVQKKTSTESSSNKLSDACVQAENNEPSGYRKSQESQNYSSPYFSRNETTIVPNTRLANEVCKTLPKVTPSRKVQNINLILRPRPKLQLAGTARNVDDDGESRKENEPTNIYTNIEKEPAKAVSKNKLEIPCDTPTKMRVDLLFKTPRKKAPLDSSLLDETDDSSRTPKVKKNFKVPDVSTPKQESVDLFYSDEVDYIHQNTSSSSKPDIIEDSIVLESSQNLMEEAFVVEKSFVTRGDCSVSMSEGSEGSSDEKSVNYLSLTHNTSRRSKNSFLERYLRCVERTSVGKDETVSPSQLKQSSSKVREIVKMINSNNLSSFSAKGEGFKSNDVTGISVKEGTQYNPQDVSNEESSPRADEKEEESDLVYWIPIPRSRLARTSTLQSGVSKLNDNGLWSPSISMLEDDNTQYQCQRRNWIDTLGKNGPSNEKVYRNYETVVIDSGYSDKSDLTKNDNENSITNSDYPADALHDSDAKYYNKRLPLLSRRRMNAA